MRTCENCSRRFETADLLALHNNSIRKCVRYVDCPFVSYGDALTYVCSTTYELYAKSRWRDIDYRKILFDLYCILGLAVEGDLITGDGSRYQKISTDHALKTRPNGGGQYFVNPHLNPPSLNVCVYEPSEEVIGDLEGYFLAHWAADGYSFCICYYGTGGCPVMHKKYCEADLGAMFTEIKMHFTSVRLDGRSIYRLMPHQKKLIRSPSFNTCHAIYETVCLHIMMSRATSSLGATVLIITADTKRALPAIKKFAKTYYGLDGITLRMSSKVHPGFDSAYVIGSVDDLDGLPESICYVNCLPYGDPRVAVWSLGDLHAAQESSYSSVKDKCVIADVDELAVYHDVLATRIRLVSGEPSGVIGDEVVRWTLNQIADYYMMFKDVPVLKGFPELFDDRRSIEIVYDAEGISLPFIVPLLFSLVASRLATSRPNDCSHSGAQFEQQWTIINGSFKYKDLIMRIQLHPRVQLYPRMQTQLSFADIRRIYHEEKTSITDAVVAALSRKRYEFAPAIHLTIPDCVLRNCRSVTFEGIPLSTQYVICQRILKLTGSLHVTPDVMRELLELYGVKSEMPSRGHEITIKPRIRGCPIDTTISEVYYI